MQISLRSLIRSTSVSGTRGIVNHMSRTSHVAHSARVCVGLRLKAPKFVFLLDGADFQENYSQLTATA